jgi:transposase
VFNTFNRQNAKGAYTYLNNKAGKWITLPYFEFYKYLKSALTEAAHSVRGSKNYLGALYRRTASRKDKKRAGIVVAHAICYVSLIIF